MDRVQVKAALAAQIETLIDGVIQTADGFAQFGLSITDTSVRASILAEVVPGKPPVKISLTVGPPTAADLAGAR